MIAAKPTPVIQDDQIVQPEVHSDPLKWKPNEEERRVFGMIDREKENADITRYQQTGDNNLLQSLYELRTPTLKVWAKRFGYLADTPEDFLSELNRVWMKAVERYDVKPKLTALRNRDGSFVMKDGKKQKKVRVVDFNTVFYTYCHNYVVNQYKRRYSKKRTAQPGVPAAGVTLSLDYCYGDKDDTPLQELLEDQTVVGADQNYGVELIISQIAKGDADVRRALERYAYDSSFKKLSLACQVAEGRFHLTELDRRILVRGGRNADARLKLLIKQSGEFPEGFSLLTWQVDRTHVKYEVEVNDKGLYRRVLAAIRNSGINLQKESKDMGIMVPAH